MAVVPTVERRDGSPPADGRGSVGASAGRPAEMSVASPRERSDQPATGGPVSGEGDRAERLLRWAAIGVISFHVVLPAVELARVAAYPGPVPGGYGHVFVRSLIFTACYLPLHLRHVLHFVRAERRATDVWTLAAMVILFVAAMPVVRSGWLFMFASLASSVLIVLRPPWSLVLVVPVLAAPFGLGLANDWSLGMSVYFSLAVLWRSSTLFLVAWLVAAARQLHQARRELAADAVVGERLRIERELRESVGAELGELTAQGRRACALVENGDVESTASALHGIVDTSRRTLAMTRTIIAGYRGVSFADEVAASVTLLRAAGFDATLTTSRDARLDDVDEPARAEFRVVLARLLREEPNSHRHVELVCAPGSVVVRRSVEAADAAAGRIAP